MQGNDQGKYRMYKKNQLIHIRIEDIGTDGEGIGHCDGFTVFVKDALVGDEVSAKLTKVKKNYAYARCEKILTPSPDRVAPGCAIAKSCGGCQLQSLSYEKQLEFKARKVRENLERIGGFEDIARSEEKIIGMEDPFRYRNKAQYPVGRSKDGRLIAGFYAGRTHVIMETEDCLISVSENRQILRIILSHMEKYRIEPYNEATGTGLVRHILIRKGFSSKELMVCLVLNGEHLPHQEELVQSLAGIKGMTSVSLNINKEQTNVILGSKLFNLFGNGYITDQISSLQFRISPLSFFQVNPVQTRRLYQKVLEYADLQGEETVWDLYCGAGTISLFLAQKAKQVIGVEVVPEAIENARENALINNIENVLFHVGKAEEIVPEEVEKKNARADVVVVDPPRKGCEESLLATILTMKPERIVYVSCDSATLARDLKYLCSNEYRLNRFCPVDMFPQTVHIETVALLSL